MAGFVRFFGVVCVLFASASVVSCGGANAPVSDARNNEEARTPPPVQLEVGDPAPEFSLPASDGRVYSLASYRGKQAVVLAWIAKAFTGP
jgi:AhpC/TSA family protein